VCDQETSNEEAKARHGAVENTTKRVVTPRKKKGKKEKLPKLRTMVEPKEFWPHTRDVHSRVVHSNFKTVAGLRLSQENSVQAYR
jgi:hypothetical protein